MRRPIRHPFLFTGAEPSTSWLSGHPIFEGYDPSEGRGWCYVDELMLDLSDRATPQRGPIPRYV